jgi:hypothetical protein
MPGTTESELHSDSNADFFNDIRRKQSLLIPEMAVRLAATHS